MEKNKNMFYALHASSLSLSSPLLCRSLSVLLVVRTLDSESSNPSSNLGGTFLSISFFYFRTSLYPIFNLLLLIIDVRTNQRSIWSKVHVEEFSKYKL